MSFSSRRNKIKELRFIHMWIELIPSLIEDQPQATTTKYEGIKLLRKARNKLLLQEALQVQNLK